MADERRIVVVLAGVIEREGRFLLTRRLKDTHLAGYWEFPGGKCELDESHEACLVRELREELDVSAVVGDEILTSEHDYGDRTVRIHFRRCDLVGDPTPQLGQEMRWVQRHELAMLQLPPADDELIEILVSRRDR